MKNSWVSMKSIFGAAPGDEPDEYSQPLLREDQTPPPARAAQPTAAPPPPP